MSICSVDRIYCANNLFLYTSQVDILKLILLANGVMGE